MCHCVILVFRGQKKLRGYITFGKEFPGDIPLFSGVIYHTCKH